MEEVAQKVPAPKPSEPGRIRVLLVEDHTVVRQAMAERLSKEKDIEVISLAASEGHIALEVARRHKPDIILMDLNMPGMDGFEATRRVKAEMPDVNVIGLSIDTDPETSKKMIEAGASAHMSKTDTLDELLKAIRHFAKKPSSAPET